MFRRNLFEQVGGYRAEFSKAQDWDLWFRLIERSKFHALDSIHYRAEINPMGISMSGLHHQQQLGQLAEMAHHLRCNGQSDAECYSAAAMALCGNSRLKSPADGCYFIGSFLMAKGNPDCRKYFLKAAMDRPQELKFWIRLIKSLIFLRSSRKSQCSSFR
jgi:hypothetical protein